VSFSGDKLLGGPQAGFIVGRKGLITKINRNPLKRTLRVDKIRLAAIEATLRLYRDPDRLIEQLPTVRMLARKRSEILHMARRLREYVVRAVSPAFHVDIADCSSQIGSGALPCETVPSASLAIRPANARAGGRLLATLASKLRNLPIPVIGRIEDGVLILDLRCLDDETAFLANLAMLEGTGDALA
jgi:L-seryl-tRNA(Ser) seleniumtransferase